MKKKVRAELPQDRVLAEALHRGILKHFPGGIDPDDEWSSAKLLSELAAHFNVDDQDMMSIGRHLDQLPKGWRASSPNDPKLIGLLP